MDVAGIFRRLQELSLTDNVEENRETFKSEFDIFLLAEGLAKVADARKVTSFLNVIQSAAEDIYHTFLRAHEADANVINKLETYCIPKRSEPFERHPFTCRMQAE